ncbi:hypothetical protein KARMA_0004 [Donghicola eburneus]|uniref:Uncharacterized protein n=1 Tax=Donghicola eburneus TaxID=393278 RepID=A0A1M4MW17_9RHOB|nr:hypothetical protein KARMA_0004 [Donghicola eburneus]
MIGADLQLTLVLATNDRKAGCYCSIQVPCWKAAKGRRLRF